MTAAAPLILPPRRFRPAGGVSEARFSHSPPPFIRPKKRRGSRRRGQLYEARVHEALGERFGDWYLPNPWLQFWQADSLRDRWCQVDGLIFLPEILQVIIVEVKLHHTAQAWWQLERLYRPVLETIFLPGAWKMSSLELVRFYDPMTPFPERPAMIPDVLMSEPGRFAVHIWNPARGVPL